MPLIKSVKTRFYLIKICLIKNIVDKSTKLFKPNEKNSPVKLLT